MPAVGSFGPALYGKAPHHRQRWKCILGNGEPAHRFAEVLPRQRAKTHACLECETVLEPWEGQQVARSYDFTTREIARALVRGGARRQLPEGR